MANLIGGRTGSSDPNTLVSEVSLAIPANTWTEIPLPLGFSAIFDYTIIENGIDITDSLVVQQTLNSFEILSLNALTTTIIVEGI